MSPIKELDVIEFINMIKRLPEEVKQQIVDEIGREPTQTESEEEQDEISKNGNNKIQ